MRLGILPEQGGSLANLRRTGQDTRFIDQYVRRYVREFDEVYYLSYARERLEREVASNFHLHPNPGIHRWFYTFLMPLIQRRALSRCSVLRVMQATGAIPARIARLFFGVPFVITYGYHYGLHAAAEADMRFKWLRVWLFNQRALWALRQADGVIVTTPKLLEFARKYKTDDRIALIPNNVDTDRFAPVSQMEKQEPSCWRLITVGQLAPRKNNKLILDAITQINRNDLEVVFIGKGPEEQFLRKYATKRGITLKLPGIVPNEQLPKWLQRADLYLIASEREGHPKSLLEAMSVGLPCIGTDAPGIRDVLTDEKTGWLCRPETDALAQTIGKVLSDKNAARVIGNNARQFVLEHYSADVVLAREIEFLKKIAQHGQRSPKRSR